MKKLKIQIKDYDYTCADGCCSDTYRTIVLNGEELEHPDSTKDNYISNIYLGYDVELSLRAVLSKLGYEVEIECV